MPIGYGGAPKGVEYGFAALGVLTIGVLFFNYLEHHSLPKQKAEYALVQKAAEVKEMRGIATPHGVVPGRRYLSLETSTPEGTMPATLFCGSKADCEQTKQSIDSIIASGTVTCYKDKMFPVCEIEKIITEKRTLDFSNRYLGHEYGKDNCFR